MNARISLGSSACMSDVLLSQFGVLIKGTYICPPYISDQERAKRTLLFLQFPKTKSLGCSCEMDYSS